MKISNALFALCSVLLVGCVTDHFKNTAYTTEVKDRGVLKGPAGEISNVVLGTDSISFEFKNTTAKTSKILWNESAFVGIDGKARLLLPGQAAVFDIGRTIAPDIVPAGASIKAEGYVRDRGQSSPQAAANKPVVPCADIRFAEYEKCSPANYYNKIVVLLLTVENDDKKTEYKVDNVLLKSKNELPFTGRWSN